jgi:hypothetical protein
MDGKWITQFACDKLQYETQTHVLLRYMPLIRGEYVIELLNELGYIESLSLDETNKNTETCVNCKSYGQLLFDNKQADLICSQCGCIKNEMDVHIGYNDYKNLNIIRKSIYKPLDHLTLILDEFCCKRTQMDDELLKNIVDYIQKKKEKMTIKTVRKSLRKLGFKQHYLMLPTIMENLNPNMYKPCVLSGGDRIRIEAMFKKYIIQFEESRVVLRIKRKNLLNYHFVIYKIVQILNIDSNIIQYLNLPKGGKTLREHETIWNQLQI